MNGAKAPRDEKPGRRNCVQRIHSIGIPAVAVILLGLASGGCLSAHFSPPQTTLGNAQAQFNVPPKEMVAKIKEVVAQPPLSLSVQQQSHGTILTDFQPFPGEIHIARRWQERTQYQIQVVPDFDEPNSRCTVFVRQSTETRAAEGMKWEVASDVNRDDRAEALLNVIKQKAAGPTSNP
jgi:hypothetical protein